SFDGLNDRVDIRDGWTLRVRNAADTAYADFYYDSDFNTDISGTGDNWDIRPGNGGRVRIWGPNTGLQLRDGGPLRSGRLTTLSGHKCPSKIRPAKQHFQRPE
ncbi:hypothetical protein LCGC14_3079510, partial [marine sediment metagenome]